MIFQYIDIICNDQIRAIHLSITSNIYHYFVLGTYKIYVLFIFLKYTANY